MKAITKSKDLTNMAKQCWNNVDKNNRGHGSAGVYPKNWDENTVKPRKVK